VPTTPSTWVQSRTSTTLFLFGGAEEQPVGETPQLSAKQKAQQVPTMIFSCSVLVIFLVYWLFFDSLPFRV
jgi:hypothetical protein